MNGKFRNKREARRCAKAWGLLTLYNNPQTDGMPSEQIENLSEWVDDSIFSMCLPDGWHLCETYSEFEKWYIENV